MYIDLEKIFESQLKLEFRINNKEHLPAYKSTTYFGRKISLSDKLLFAYIIEQVSDTQIHMVLAILTERDFSKLSKKFTLDQTLTEMQFRSKSLIRIPIFVNNKILDKYLCLKGIKKDGNGKK